MSSDIKIKTPYIELDSLLKYANLVNSGGEAKIYIKDGHVKLNGEVCTMRKKKIYPGDKVSFNSNEINIIG